MTDTTATTIDQLTPAGRDFMRLVGSGAFDFFDDGIVEGSGIWGRHMAQQAAPQMGKSARSIGGIMARLSELELWTVEDQGRDMSGNAQDTVWWALTELGAAVANQLAITDAEPETPAEAVSVAKPQGSHATCAHPSTKAARAACRKARAKGVELEAPAASPEVEEARAAAQLVVDTATDADDAIAEIELLRDEDVLPELDADAYADAVIADLGGQQ